MASNSDTGTTSQPPSITTKTTTASSSSSSSNNKTEIKSKIPNLSTKLHVLLQKNDDDHTGNGEESPLLNERYLVASLLLSQSSSQTEFKHHLSNLGSSFYSLILWSLKVLEGYSYTCQRQCNNPKEEEEEHGGNQESATEKEKETGGVGGNQESTVLIVLFLWRRLIQTKFEILGNQEMGLVFILGEIINHRATHCTSNLIGLLDVQVIEVLTLLLEQCGTVLQEGGGGRNRKNGPTSNPWAEKDEQRQKISYILANIPECMLGRYKHHLYAKKEEEVDNKVGQDNSQDDKETDHELNPDDFMHTLVEQVYRTSNTPKHEKGTLTWLDQKYQTAMVNFFPVHLRFVESVVRTCPRHKFILGDTFHIITPFYIQQLVGILTSTDTIQGMNEGMQDDSSTVTHPWTLDPNTQSLFHASLLSYLTWMMTFSSEQDFISSPSDSNVAEVNTSKSLLDTLGLGGTKTREEGQRLVNDLNKPIQRLIVLGISVVTDTITSSSEKKKGGTQSHQVTSNGIRNMTVKLLALLIEDVGLNWTIAPQKKHQENSSSLGVGAIFCMLLRLTCGELRITMGRILDDELTRQDPDNPHGVGICCKDDAEKIKDCIKITISSLRFILELADERETKTGKVLQLNADAILHVRHSLLDVLDTSVQFLLDDLSDGSSPIFNECALSCCRYLGAYLSEVGVFEHSMEDDRNHDQQSNINISSVRLLKAIHRGLSISSNNGKSQKILKQESTHENFSVVTLLPSIVAILSSCEDQQEKNMIQKYLLFDTLLVDVISLTIEQSLKHFDGISYVGTQSFGFVQAFDTCYWCFLVIESWAEHFASKFDETMRIADWKMSVEKLCGGMQSLLKKLVSSSLEGLDSDDFDNDHLSLLSLITQSLITMKKELGDEFVSHMIGDELLTQAQMILLRAKY